MQRLIEIIKNLGYDYIEYSDSDYPQNGNLEDYIDFIRQDESPYINPYSGQRKEQLKQLLADNPELREDLLNVVYAYHDNPQTKFASWVLNVNTGIVRAYDVGNLPERSAYTFSRLEELGAAKARLSYAGSGDSGEEFDITLTDSDGNEIELDENITPHMEAFFGYVLADNHSGWEINEGSRGFIDVDVSHLAESYFDLENPRPQVISEHESYFINQTLSIEKKFERDEHGTGELLDQLSALLPPSAQIEIHYSGSADDTDGLYVQVFDRPDNAARSTSQGLSDELAKAVDEYAENLLDTLASGWYDGEGGQGVIRINLGEQTVLLEHYGNETDSETFELDWFVQKFFEYHADRDGDLVSFIEQKTQEYKAKTPYYSAFHSPSA